MLMKGGSDGICDVGLSMGENHVVSILHVYYRLFTSVPFATINHLGYFI